jgi:hypothetical protein
MLLNVRVGSMVKSLLLAAVIGLICNGCGGLSATPAISPLMFLMPGLGQVKPAHSTNAPSMLVASKRDLSQVN